ncbi:MAG: DNA polymerase III subunit delta' [Parachlamydiaceae bacterium]|nr:DNA polymerase III subunit delta' [Parachlamydiaceae bacterium]
MMNPTNFSQLIGNDPIKGYLKRMIERDAMANSLLFAGPDGIGKSLFALTMAVELMCQNDPFGIQKKKIASGNHPDIHHYRPEGKLGLHSIKALRELCEEVFLPPYEAPVKVFIIHDADRMLSYSANALLKTFEEPPSNTIIVLLSSNPSALLPTVLSRCRTIHFHSISEHEIEQYLKTRYQLDDELLKRVAGLAHGSLSRAISLLEQKGSPTRDLILSLLMRGKVRTYKNLIEAVHTITEQIEAAKKQTEIAAKEELYKVPTENLSAHHQQILEKELEGAVSMSQVQEVYALLDIILSWYRDLHLLQVGGATSYLINQDYEMQLEDVLQQGNIIPFDQLQKAVEETRLLLQRSTSLQICMENLFLKLNLV